MIEKIIKKRKSIRQFDKKLVDTEVRGLGRISVAYAKDPEGNIIELQKVV